ncbi:DUF2690 domain-containing protein [Streptomyces sp. NPDC006296]|uniref:helix-turn-helix domain-containing protein n=1 Tax=Streptomyces sp. NPDC006296 TaxID=3156746 RepID=UPI0033A973F2
MPRWKALPEEIDPELREFTTTLRGLVDGGGLSLAAVADRTGYSRTSWEHYLNGRLLAPEGAVVALAEATGTPPDRLTAMWEPVEQAWSRSEARHDLMMETVRNARARAAPGAAGVAPAPAVRRRPGRAAAGRRTTGGRRAAPAEDAESPAAAAAGPERPAPAPARRDAGPPTPRRTRPVPAPEAEPAGDGSGKEPAGDGSGTEHGGPPGKGRRRAAPVLLCVVGALLLTAGAVLFLRQQERSGGDPGSGPAAAAPSADPGARALRSSAGAGCEGADCTGRDPESMGCGRSAGTVARRTVGGSLVEVRYSETCHAAWARITRASPGDAVRITAGSSEGRGAVEADAEAYTPMLAIRKVSEVRACATLTSGAAGCTAPGE